jgi:Outer membrane protein beta-barrel domain
MLRKSILSITGCLVMFWASAQNGDDYIIASPDQPAIQSVTRPALVKPNMELGITGGGGLSILYNQRPFDNPRTPGKAPYSSTAFGVSYQYNFPKIISIRTELNMERKGDIMYSTITNTTNGEGQPVQITNYGYDKFNYLSLPVMARLSFGKRVQFFTDLGFYVSTLFNAERFTSSSYIIPPGDNVSSSSNTQYISRGLHAWDAGAVTGVGLAIPVWKGVEFNLEARNNLGLANINAGNEYYSNKLYNDNFNLLVGLNFFLANSTKNNDRLPNLK